MSGAKNQRIAAVSLWYKNFGDFKGEKVTTYKFHGRRFTIKAKSTKLFLVFEFFDEGKLVWTLPVTKKALKKIKKFLNRIGDL